MNSQPDHVDNKSSKPPLAILPIIARILLGLLFVITGLNGFLHFMPPPKAPMPSGAMAFVGAMMQTRYMFPLVFAIQLIAGALLLTGRFVPLALVLIAPVVVNIFMFHAFLAPAGLGLASVVAALEIYLAWSYRDSFRSVLESRVSPSK